MEQLDGYGLGVDMINGYYGLLYELEYRSDSLHAHERVLMTLDGMLAQKSLDDDGQFPTLFRRYLFRHHDQLGG